MAFEPWATQIDVAITHWPQHYDASRYEILLLFTSTHFKVVDLSASSQFLASGGWSQPAPINATLRRLHLATLPSGVRPHGIPNTWYLLSASSLHVMVTALTARPVPPRDWRIVILVLLARNGKTVVRATRVITPRTIVHG